MCLAIPARIESVEGEQATASLAGASVRVALTLTPQAKVGDWVLVHAGYAIATVPEEQARETFALLEELQQPEQT